MTKLFQRGPAAEINRFQLNLDRVTFDHRSIESAICCMQSFVRYPLFTQRDFFTDNGFSMLLSAVNVAGSVCEDSVYDPWAVILPEGYAAVVADLKRRMMLSWFAERMLDALLNDGLVWRVSSLPLLESPLVSKLFGSQMLLKSVTWNFCPNLFLPYKRPARVSVSKALEKANRKE